MFPDPEHLHREPWGEESVLHGEGNSLLEISFFTISVHLAILNNLTQVYQSKVIKVLSF